MSETAHNPNRRKGTRNKLPVIALTGTLALAGCSSEAVIEAKNAEIEVINTIEKGVPSVVNAAYIVHPGVRFRNEPRTIRDSDATSNNTAYTLGDKEYAFVMNPDVVTDSAGQIWIGAQDMRNTGADPLNTENIVWLNFTELSKQQNAAKTSYIDMLPVEGDTVRYSDLTSVSVEQDRLMTTTGDGTVQPAMVAIIGVSETGAQKFAAENGFAVLD